MRYHLRLWRQAILVHIIVLLLTVLLCSAVATSLLMDEVAGNRLAYLETLDDYVQKVLYAAQRELITIGNQNDWLELVRRLSSSESALGSFKAHEDLNLHLIKTVSGNSFFKTMYLITPKHIYSSGFTNVTIQQSRSDSLKWFLDGSEMRNTLTYALDEHNYLVAQLDTACMFVENVQNLYVTNRKGDCIYMVADSAQMEEWLRQTGTASAQNSVEHNRSCFIDGSLYRLIVYESVSYDRLYYSLISVADTLRSSHDAFRELLIVAIVLAATIPALLYYAAWLAMKPVRWIATHVQHETTLEALSSEPSPRKTTRGSLRWRVMCVFSLTLINVIVMPLASLSIFSHYNIQYTQELYRLSMSKKAQNVGFTYAQLLRQAEKIRSEAQIMDLLKKNDTAEANREELLNSMLDLMSDMNGVTGIRLYNAQGNILLSTTPFSPILNEPLLNEYRSSYLYVTTSTSNLISNDLAILFPLRATTPSSQYKLFSCVGFVELHTEATAAGEMANPATSGREMYYLYDGESSQLLDVPMTTSGRKLIESMAQNGEIAVNRESSMRRIVWLSEDNSQQYRDYLLISEPVPNTQWHLIVLLSNDFLDGNETLLGTAMLILMAALLFIITAISSLFTRRFMRSVWHLVEYFTKATPQDNGVPRILREEGEITLIAQEFEGALSRINQLEEKERRQQEENLYLEKRKRDAEIIALQSQLDSHLISNLFASMQLLLRMNETQTLDNTLKVVARFFRNEIEMNTLDVPLAREIALTKSDVEVQKTRFHDMLQVVWAPYSQELEQLIVPKFIMQPVLENAIKHGISTDTPMQIHISITRENERLTIVIANNGSPLDENRVALINQRIDDTAPTIHIGLRNIMERLRLRYGTEESGVRLSAEPDGWICVRIWLPCNYDA